MAACEAVLPAPDELERRLGLAGTGCPYTSLPTEACDGHMYCLLHLPGAAKLGSDWLAGGAALAAFEVALRAVLLQARSTGRGADLRGIVVPPAADLPREAGALTLPPASWRGADFEGDATFPQAVMEGDVSFREAIFRGVAAFRQASFEGSAAFERVTLADAAAFRDVAFQGHASFAGAVFRGEAAFRDAAFLAGATYRQAAFHGEAIFTDAAIDGGADFTGATFHGDAHFRRTAMRGDVRFAEAVFQAGTVFDGAVIPKGSGLSL